MLIVVLSHKNKQMFVLYGSLQTWGKEILKIDSLVSSSCVPIPGSQPNKAVFFNPQLQLFAHHFHSWSRASSSLLCLFVTLGDVCVCVCVCVPCAVCVCASYMQASTLAGSYIPRLLRGILIPTPPVFPMTL
jgi:hypothetical protein